MIAGREAMAQRRSGEASSSTTKWLQKAKGCARNYAKRNAFTAAPDMLCAALDFRVAVVSRAGKVLRERALSAKKRKNVARLLKNCNVGYVGGGERQKEVRS